MTDKPELILRQAIAERVRHAQSPRPFSALPDIRERPTKQRFNVTQRPILLAAAACLAAALVGFAVYRSGSSSGGTGLATAPPADGPPTDDQIAVEAVCGDGSTGTILVPGSDIGQIDDVVNGVDVCEGRAGLAAARFTACPAPRQVEVTASNGALPYINTIDLCEQTSEDAAPPADGPPTDDQIAVEAVCGDGSTGTILVPGSDIGQIDDVVNSVDVCEGRAGLAAARFTACPAPRQVEVTASNGALPDINTIDLCEQTSEP